MDEKTVRENEERPTAGDPQEEHPAQEAHGGSMAPGLVDDTGQQVTDAPSRGDEQ